MATQEITGDSADDEVNRQENLLGGGTPTNPGN